MITHYNSDNGCLHMVQNNLRFAINFKAIQFIWITTSQKNIKEDILNILRQKMSQKIPQKILVFADEDNSGIRR